MKRSWTICASSTPPVTTRPRQSFRVRRTKTQEQEDEGEEGEEEEEKAAAEGAEGAEGVQVAEEGGVAEILRGAGILREIESYCREHESSIATILSYIILEYCTILYYNLRVCGESQKDNRATERVISYLVLHYFQ